MILIISGIFLGVIVGLFLSFMAFEELISGERYLRFAKRVLLTLIFLTINYYLVVFGMYSFAIVFSLAIILGFVLEIKQNTMHIEWLYYAIFVLMYIFLFYTKVEIWLLETIAGLVLLYGIPVGTLMHLNFIRGKVRTKTVVKNKSMNRKLSRRKKKKSTKKKIVRKKATKKKVVRKKISKRKSSKRKQ